MVYRNGRSLVERSVLAVLQTWVASRVFGLLGYCKAYGADFLQSSSHAAHLYTSNHLQVTPFQLPEQWRVCSTLRGLYDLPAVCRPIEFGMAFSIRLVQQSTLVATLYDAVTPLNILG